MAVDLNNNELIDVKNANFRTLFANLQGNILKGHGRDHTVHIFMEFGPDPAAARAGLSEAATQYVTPFAQQLEETRQFKEFPAHIPGGLFGNVFLTAKGFRALGYTQATLDARFPTQPEPFFSTASNFLEGMIKHADELNDPAPDTWEAGYREGRIDAMFLLADDDEGFLLREARRLMNHLNDFATILTVERGRALRSENSEGIEHFGYVDGRSQPIYLQQDMKGEGKTDLWNPFEPLKRVLVADPNTTQPDAFGSYFVFRKLEQDVMRFKIREQELADALKLKEEERERAGAMVVGRFEDGTPLALSQTDGLMPPKENNFRFDIDPEGLRCPFQAHIRKTNPRGDLLRLAGSNDEETLERQRRITRRGIPFGKRNEHPQALQGLDDLPRNGVGLLFMCFQADITNQFAFIQRNWVNAAGFVRQGTGMDPVLGQRANPDTPLPAAEQLQWSPEWGQAPAQKTPFGFENFVTMKGGDYFFAPSIPFLRELAAGLPGGGQV